MRKFTLLFAFLLSLIGVAQAQTVITDLAQLSNGKVYTLTGERGTLLTFDGATMLYGTFAGDKAGVAYDASDPYQQFAILKSDKGNLYLYNVGTGKFVLQSEKKNPLSFDPTQTLEVVAAGSPDTANGRLWLLKVNRNMINFSGGHNEAGMCANYNTEDPGNRFCITEVGTFANETAVVAAINNYENWETTKAPTLSTDDAPVYYSIKNLRQNKYAAYNTLGSALKQTNVYAEAGAVWYFVSAGDTYTNSEGKEVIPVYIKNAATDLALVSATSMSYAETGTIFYLIKHANSGKDGYVISKGDVTTNWSSWNDKSGTEVCDYKGDDAGSIWAFAPVFPTAVAAAAAGESEMFAGELTAAKTAAMEQVEALGNRDYYAYSSADVEECKTAIDAVTATTFAGIATAKEEIDACLVALKAKTPTVNVLVGGEYIKFHWARDTHYYLTTDASDATSEAAANATKVLGNQVANDIRNIWQVVANSEKAGFYLYNPLSGKFIKHAAGAQLTLVADITEAGVYTFNPQNDYFWVIGGTGENDYITLESTGWAVGGEAVDNDNRANWFVEKPTKTQIESLETQLATIDELRATAIADANTQIEALNTGLEFYRYDETKMIALKSDVAAKINAAADRIALATAEAEVNAMIAAFINATDNRTTPVSVGIKVEFVNKFASEYYISTNNNGATTSNQTNSNVIWELVQAEGGYYLYNPLANAYVVHPTADNQQAALSATTDGATIYTIVPNGRYVNIAKVVDQVNTEDHNYLHYGADNCVVQWVANADKSLWTVTSATDTELTQLAEDIKAKVQSQYNTTLTAANNVVAPYKNRAFYVPQTAITTYESAVKAIALPTTYAELATAEAAVNQARTDFEAGIAANDVEYTNKLENGIRVKFNWTRDTKYHLTTNTTLSETTSAPSATQAKGRQNAGLHAIWEVVANDDNTGFYLYNTLSGKYIKHPAEQGVCAALVSDKAQATAYNFKPYQDGTIKIYANDGTGENDILYINGWENVVCYDAEEQRSFFTPLKVSDEDWTAASQAVRTNISTAFSAHKDAADQVVEQYMNLAFYTGTQEAKAAYIKATSGLSATTYAELHNAKTKIDEALAVFINVDRRNSNPVIDGVNVKFLNRQHNKYITISGRKMSATNNVDGGSVWTLKAANGGGFYLYNNLANAYVKHQEYDNQPFDLVADMANATPYYIHPDGIYVSVGKLAEVSTSDESRDYLHGVSSEAGVVRWNAKVEASFWGISLASSEEVQAAEDAISAYVQETIRAAKDEALVKAQATDDVAYYACSVEYVTTAVNAIREVQTNITTHTELAEELQKIESALTTLYNSERTAGPVAGDHIRLVNKVYSTDYLGYNETGLGHYVPTDGTTGQLPSTTIWTLEEVLDGEGKVVEGKFYLKNYLLNLYACFEWYDETNQIVLRRQKEYPVEVIKHDMIDGIYYLEVKTGNSEVKDGFRSLCANDNGLVVQGGSGNESLWKIVRATQSDMDGVNSNDQLHALINFMLLPTIENAKRYYYKDSEGEVVNNFVDEAKAGHYTFKGEEGEIWESFKEQYVRSIDNALDFVEESSNKLMPLNQVVSLVETLEANMAKLKLNLPNRSGFFRVKCVYNNQYLQSNYQEKKSERLALNEEQGKASIFYFEAEETVNGGGRLISYDQGLYLTQGSYNGIYAKLQGIGTLGDALIFEEPHNKTFGSYNIKSLSAGRYRYMYGNARVTEGEEYYYYVDNGDNATVAIQGDTNNNGYNWIFERVQQIPVSINKFGYATFYAPVALKLPEGVHAYVAGSVNELGNELSMSELEGVIPPKTAVVLQVKEELKGTVIYLEDFFDYEETTTPEIASGNAPILRGSAPKVNRGDNPSPELNQVENGKIYTFQSVNEVIGFHPYTGTIFNHFRAFLELPKEVNASALKLKLGDNVTSIDKVFNGGNVQGAIYDLNGRRVTNPSKGVYIVNGRKMYFK